MVSSSEHLLLPLPERVLDVGTGTGTGTGIWPMDFADEYPSAVVVATDLSQIQPSWVPPNAKFVRESDWQYSPAEAFDYIQGKSLGESIADRPLFLPSGLRTFEVRWMVRDVRV